MCLCSDLWGVQGGSRQWWRWSDGMCVCVCVHAYLQEAGDSVLQPHVVAGLPGELGVAGLLVHVVAEGAPRQPPRRQARPQGQAGAEGAVGLLVIVECLHDDKLCNIHKTD